MTLVVRLRNCHRCDRQEWCTIVKKECPGNAKHTWNSKLFSPSASFYSLYMLLVYFLLSSCSVATSRRWWLYWEALGWNVWRALLKMVFSRSLFKIRWHGCWWGWFRSLGAQRKTTVDGAEGRSACQDQGGCYGTADALWHFKQSTASVINRKGSHVKKKPFQLQPLELQCRTHTHTYIQTHTQTITHGLGQSPKADSSVSKAGLLAPILQLIHMKCY